MAKQVTQSELNQVATEIKNGFQSISDRLNAIETKVEVGQAEIKGEIKALDERLSGKIKSLDERLTGKIDTLDEKLSGQINTLDTKVNGLDKRLSNVETSVQKIPELAEKVGEFKWWKQFILIVSSGTVGAFLAKIFGNQN